jgi:hypothetical protein
VGERANDKGDGLRPASDELLVGAGYLKMLDKHRRRLHAAGGEHPNRVLHYDDVFTLLLLSFFNPALRSLRTIDDASRGPSMRGCLDVDRACRSTLSDANACLDPSLLLPVIEDLRKKVPDLPRADAALQQLLNRAVAVDGSLFSVAAGVAWGLRKRKPWAGAGPGGDDRFVRLDLQFCCARGVIQEAEINGRGTSETTAARRKIEAGRLYIADRGIFSFAYVDDLLRAKADLVLRIKKSQRLTVLEERPVSAKSRAAGLLSDRRVTLDPAAKKPAKAAANVADVPAQVLREVVVLDVDHPDKPIRLLTSLLDVDAEIVGEAYRWRWQIELFFRWLKVHANFRHLISHSKNGLTLGFYVATIAVLLIYLRTGRRRRRVSKYAYNALCLVAQGAMTPEQALEIVAFREREKDLERARLARKRAAAAAAKTKA